MADHVVFSTVVECRQPKWMPALANLLLFVGLE
jgi:hypothetical protein